MPESLMFRFIWAEHPGGFLSLWIFIFILLYVFNIWLFWNLPELYIHMQSLIACSVITTNLNSIRLLNTSSGQIKTYNAELRHQDTAVPWLCRHDLFMEIQVKVGIFPKKVN